MTEGRNDHHETNRDRVRRLVFQPLGFRHPKRMGEDEGRAILDQIADDLAYLPDDRLAALAEALRGKGEGSARDFWPSRASILGHADWLCPRPLQMAPALLRWFASVEGPRAIAEGVLVETWQHFERHKAPPVGAQAQARVAQLAADNARRLTLIDDRRARGVGVHEDDAAWARWYRDRLRRCTEAVEQARAAKAAA